MTVDVMAKLEEYMDEQADITMTIMIDRLLSDTSVEVSVTSIHRAQHGMLYTDKGHRIEKTNMNNMVNKEKRVAFAKALNKHVSAGDMIVYHDETNFNIYLARNQGWSRVGERAIITLPPSNGKNIHLQCGMSPGNGLVLLCTHDGSVRVKESARFVTDLFVAALISGEEMHGRMKQGGIKASLDSVTVSAGLSRITRAKRLRAPAALASVKRSPSETNSFVSTVSAKMKSNARKTKKADQAECDAADATTEEQIREVSMQNMVSGGGIGKSSVTILKEFNKQKQSRHDDEMALRTDELEARKTELEAQKRELSAKREVETRQIEVDRELKLKELGSSRSSSVEI